MTCCTTAIQPQLKNRTLMPFVQSASQSWSVAPYPFPTHTHTHINTNTHIHTHAHMHTHAHTCTQTHMHMRVLIHCQGNAAPRWTARHPAPQGDGIPASTWRWLQRNHCRPRQDFVAACKHKQQWADLLLSWQREVVHFQHKTNQNKNARQGLHVHSSVPLVTVVWCF